MNLAQQEAKQIIDCSIAVCEFAGHNVSTMTELEMYKTACDISIPCVHKFSRARDANGNKTCSKCGSLQS